MSTSIVEAFDAVAQRQPHASALSWRGAAWTYGDLQRAIAAVASALANQGVEPGARIARLVYGAWDPRQGAAGSAFNLVAADAMNHRVDAYGGVLSEECGALLRRFFAGRR